MNADSMTAQQTAAENSSAGELLDATISVKHQHLSGKQHPDAQLSPGRGLSQQPHPSQQVAQGLAAAEQALDASLAQGLQPEAVQAAIRLAVRSMASADPAEHDLKEVRGLPGLRSLAF